MRAFFIVTLLLATSGCADWVRIPYNAVPAKLTPVVESCISVGGAVRVWYYKDSTYSITCDYQWGK